MGGSPSFPVLSQQGRTAIVTGGNSGIGYEAAKHLAMMGASVVIACRSEDRARQAIELMQTEAGQLKASPVYREVTVPDRLDVQFMLLDLCSLKSTMEFIEAYKATGRKLHLLLCNAGLGALPREITDDGFEKQFQVNYLGHFLIVAHLISVMRSSGEDCRIIFTSSRAHQRARFNLATAQAPPEAPYRRLRYYGNSKLYQIQHMFCLSRRLFGTNISVTSLHPGVVRTNFWSGFQDNKCLYCILSCHKPCIRSPLHGAVTLIDLAVSPNHKRVSGVYMKDCRAISPSSAARNVHYQEQLWQYSLDLLKQYITSDIISALEKTT